MKITNHWRLVSAACVVYPLAHCLVCAEQIGTVAGGSGYRFIAFVLGTIWFSYVFLRNVIIGVSD